MRHLLGCLLLACACAANAQVELSDPLPFPDVDLDLQQGGAAWLVGDHVKARHHFRAAAQRGHPLGQYNLAMMLLHREGGACGSAEAVALLRKAAAGRISLAREALEQARYRGAAQQGLEHPFACPLLGHARP
jgi:TPR repeat protein